MSHTARRKPLRQIFSYLLVGALTNLSGFGLYILLTYLGSTPKWTMTVLYSAGAIIGFFANRRFTFGHDGHVGSAGVRYLIAQLLGYLLNFILLLLFVDWLGFSHQIVQAIAIVVVAVFMFILSRAFVFPPRTTESWRVR
ncbi:GtrA family protein [Pseudomonas sichuanensis]|uniref:GtrA family protein n=1 Tax=Pseudomonas sichuanensis TaxID=2213015 RepID=UPI00215FCB41|nr:GtrA family protein [Pseudomonas sichuanensis]UVL89036.1 GtrA family protein [Pseudomonas sichuanensis]